MSAPKPTRVPLQDFLDGIAIEEETARLAELSYEQIAQELRADGIDPERARAAVQRALDKSDAEGGAPPAAASPRASNVVSLASRRERRGPGVIPIALALAAGVAAIVGAVERREIQAWLFPAPPAPPTPLVPPTHEETPKEKAARLREAAYVNAKKGYYGDAIDQLDEAATLDPAGDKDVVAERTFIEEFRHRTTVYGGYAKPPLGPGERPLRRTP